MTAGATGLHVRLRRWARSIRADALTLWYASGHPDTPLLAKLLSVCLVVYAFSPTDLIPDFIPVIGLLDDAIILPLGILLVIRMVPESVLAECRQSAATHVERGAAKPKFVAGSILIVLIWAALALGAYAAVRRWIGG